MLEEKIDNFIAEKEEDLVNRKEVGEEFVKLYDGLQGRGEKIQILMTVNRAEQKDMLSVGVDGKYYKSYKSSLRDQIKEVNWRIQNGKRN